MSLLSSGCCEVRRLRRGRAVGGRPADAAAGLQQPSPTGIPPGDLERIARLPHPGLEAERGTRHAMTAAPDGPVADQVRGRVQLKASSSTGGAPTQNAGRRARASTAPRRATAPRISDNASRRTSRKSPTNHGPVRRQTSDARRGTRYYSAVEEITERGKIGNVDIGGRPRSEIIGTHLRSDIAWSKPMPYSTSPTRIVPDRAFSVSRRVFGAETRGSIRSGLPSVNGEFANNAWPSHLGSARRETRSSWTMRSGRRSRVIGLDRAGPGSSCRGRTGRPSACNWT